MKSVFLIICGLMLICGLAWSTPTPTPTPIPFRGPIIQASAINLGNNGETSYTTITRALWNAIPTPLATPTATPVTDYVLNGEHGWTSKVNWDTAYTDRLKWDGGATGLVAATGRTSLGLGTIATQNSSGVTITGGSLSNLTTLAIHDTSSSPSSDVVIVPTSSVALSVTRSPWINRLEILCFLSHSVISLPPPCTTTTDLPCCCR